MVCEDLSDAWKTKQRACEELYSKELPETYQHWGNILTETSSKFCMPVGSILDVGCGNPDHSIKYFGGFSFYYMGLDPFVPDTTTTIPVIKCFGEELSFEASSFDNVALMSLLDHVDDPRQIVSEAARVLRVGGTLYIMVLVWTDHFNIELDEYHLRHLSEEEVLNLVAEDFVVEATQFIPYKEDYRRVMYLKARRNEKQ